MPIGRYFFSAGSVLLALLFLADWYYPGSAAAARREVDRSILRITSEHKWPERIVFDTSLPTIVPPVLAQDAPRASDPREAFARAAPAVKVVSAPSSGSDLKPRVPRKSRVARRTRPNPSSLQQANARDVSFGW